MSETSTSTGRCAPGAASRGPARQGDVNRPFVQPEARFGLGARAGSGGAVWSGGHGWLPLISVLLAPQADRLISAIHEWRESQAVTPGKGSLAAVPGRPTTTPLRCVDGLFVSP